MPWPRWSPRNRRIAFVTAALIVTVWIVTITVVLTGDETSEQSSSSIRVTKAPPRDSPQALWLFGFATLRVDPLRPRRVGQLPPRGFGQVAGTRGGVLLYEPGAGRVGLLDARRNRLTELAAVSTTVTDTTARPAVAGSTDVAWLVTGPRDVTRRSIVDATDVTVRVGSEPNGTVTATRVVARADAVWAVTSGRGDDGRAYADLARLDPTTAVVVQTQRVDAPDGLVDVLVDGGDIVLVAPREVVVARGAEPELRTVALPRSFEAVAALVHDDALWILGRSGRLLRLDTSTGERLAPPTRVSTGPLAADTRLVASGGRMWAFLPSTSTGSLRSQLVRLDAGGRVTLRFRPPEALMIGDVTASSR